MSGSSSFLGAYLTDNPARNDPGSMSAFRSDYDAFARLMGARPRFYDAYTDNGQGAAGMPASAEWEAESFAQTGDAYVGPNSGTTPVVGVAMSDSSAQWGSVDTFYQKIISGSLDAAYKGIVDAWARNGYKTVEFRLGYEFTGGFMPWSPEASSNPNANADFVKAFQHLANLMHSEASVDGATAKIVWCPAIRQGTSYDIRTLYPGDQYVDVISTDLYSGGMPNGYVDWATGGTTVDPNYATWASKPANYNHYYQYQDSSQGNPTPGFGLSGWSTQNTIDFAKQHNKPLGIDEAGAGPNDETVFPAWLGTAIAGAQAEGVTIDHVNIFDADVSDGQWAFTGGEKPQEAAAWAQAFGTGTGNSGGTGSGGTGTGGTGTGSGSGSAPTPVTIGSGPDSLVLQVSEDAYQGDAAFTISVDGKQIGGTQTALASHAAGQAQAFTVQGSFGSGSHTVSVNFLNDAYGGSASADRNLYVNSATIDGTAIPGGTLTELSGGAQTFTFQGAGSGSSGGSGGSGSAPMPVTIGSGPNSLALQVSEDAYQGDADFTISVDGKQIGGTQTALASHAAGQSQAFTVQGSFGSGAHTVSVNFLNDAYGGSASADRNLYVNSAAIDGTAIPGGTLTELSGGAQTFAFQGAGSGSSGGSGGSGSAPTPVTIGSGPNSLVLQVSEDAYQGDAAFTISVDGRQIGGTQTALASHAAGLAQAFTVQGSFGSGSHTVSVNFLNDAYGGSASTDRNLYVNSGTINGAAISGASLAEYNAGSQSFTFQGVVTNNS